MNKLPKILIIDDEHDSRNLIVVLLKRQNYTIKTVPSGEDALVYLETDPDIDIILLDIMMPGLDGFDVLEIIKNNPQTEQIKVIMLTATNRVKDKIKAFSLGASDYMVKPFEKGELIARVETQFNLKQAEEKIGALARFPTEAPNPILRISPHGQIMFSNIAGIDLLQTPNRNEINANAPTSWQPLIAQALNTNKRIEIEHVHNKRIYSCLFVPLVDQGYVNVYGTDITQRIKAEEALRESEERHRTLAENARDLIAKLTPTGIYSYVSSASYTILGYTPDELLGRSFFDLIHPEDLFEIQQMNPPLLDFENEAVFTLRFKHKSNSYIWLETGMREIHTLETNQTELVAIARDVTERKRYETALQHAYDEMENRVTERTTALSRSNTLLKQVIEERKQAQAKIIKFNQELLTLQYAGAAIASSLDLQYILHTVTREMVDMLKIEGCAISEWNDETDTIYLLAKYGPKNWWDNGPMANPALAKKVLRTREYQQVPDSNTAYQNNTIKTLLIMPLVFQDHDVGCIEIADSRVERIFTNQEISLVQLLSSQAASAIENARLYQQAQQELAERKRMEEALEKERATLARRVEERTGELSSANAKLARAARLKDEFLASMSHELRTPLNAVLSMSEALQEEVYGDLNEKQGKALKNIEESGRHLLSLINDILDLSKIEAGKFQLQKDIVSIKRVCQSSLIFIKQMAHKKQIKVSSHIDEKATTIYADERRLKQVLVNLLSNAVKFTPEGGTVGLNVVNDKQQQTIRFTVWDTGIGIPSHRMEHLFQPFVQLDSKLSRRYAGTGLGLALVRRMAEMHGGSVSLESEVEKGSHFTVSLPAQTIEPQKPVENGKPYQRKQAPARRALVVEDSHVVADKYKRYLKELGLKTEIHSVGNGALEKAVEIIPDIIILDILLPDRSGWDILAELKKHPATKKIPVLVASVIDEREQGKAMGATSYLLKPISRKQLQKTLNKIFNPQQANSTTIQTKTSAVLKNSKTAKPLILLADDHEINLNTVSDYLLNFGYRVIAVRNGKEAIAQATELKPNLILMDIQMPEMDGLEATQQLRADSNFDKTPIIALTALAMPGDRERCLNAGANDYMSKPISLKRLTKLIEHQLNSK